MMRVSLVVTVLEALLNEQHTSTTTPLSIVMKTAATGEQDRFEEVVQQHVPTEGQHYIRALVNQTVFPGLGYRALLKTRPSKSKSPPPFRSWHVEIRHMLELLLGPREGDTPEFG